MKNIQHFKTCVNKLKNEAGIHSLHYINVYYRSTDLCNCFSVKKHSEEIKEECFINDLIYDPDCFGTSFDNIVIRIEKTGKYKHV